jgi:hypothetical protein
MHSLGSLPFCNPRSQHLELAISPGSRLCSISMAPALRMVSQYVLSCLSPNTNQRIRHAQSKRSHQFFFFLFLKSFLPLVVSSQSFMFCCHVINILARVASCRLRASSFWRLSLIGWVKIDSDPHACSFKHNVRVDLEAAVNLTTTCRIMIANEALLLYNCS